MCNDIKVQRKEWRALVAIRIGEIETPRPQNDLRINPEMTTWSRKCPHLPDLVTVQRKPFNKGSFFFPQGLQAKKL